MTIEKLIAVGDDLYTIEIKQGNRVIDVYCLDTFANKDIKITINIKEVKVNWIEVEK